MGEMSANCVVGERERQKSEWAVLTEHWTEVKTIAIEWRSLRLGLCRLYVWYDMWKRFGSLHFTPTELQLKSEVQLLNEIISITLMALIAFLQCRSTLDLFPNTASGGDPSQPSHAFNSFYRFLRQISKYWLQIYRTFSTHCMPERSASVGALRLGTGITQLTRLVIPGSTISVLSNAQHTLFNNSYAFLESLCKSSDNFCDHFANLLARDRESCDRLLWCLGFVVTEALAMRFGFGFDMPMPVSSYVKPCTVLVGVTVLASYRLYIVENRYIDILNTSTWVRADSHIGYAGCFPVSLPFSAFHRIIRVTSNCRPNSRSKFTTRLT